MNCPESRNRIFNDAMGASKDLSVVLREQHSQGWAQYDKVIRVSY